MSERCSRSVHNSYGVGFHQCGRAGTVERDGKLWCKTHDPEAIAAKRAAWNEKFDAEKKREADLIAEAERLCARLGVRGRIHYDGVIAKGYTRAVVIAFGDADRLAKELGR